MLKYHRALEGRLAELEGIKTTEFKRKEPVPQVILLNVDSAIHNNNIFYKKLFEVFLVCKSHFQCNSM